MAKGASFLIREKRIVSRVVSYLVLIFCLLVMMAFGYYEVRGFYDLKMGVDLAGEAVDRLTEKDALVITGDTADVTLLYNCNRYGWVIGYGAAYPVDENSIEMLENRGADYFVTTKVGDFEGNDELKDYFEDKHKLVEKTNEYLIYELGQGK